MSIDKKLKHFIKTSTIIAKRIWNGVSLIMLIVTAAIVINGCGNDSSSEIFEEKMVMVQEGYLGNYDAVTIKEVFEDTIKNGKWGGGTAKEGDYYIIEYKNDETIIQFSVYDDEKTFKVTGFQSENGDSSSEAYDIKLYLDALYMSYAAKHPEKGLYVDTSILNDTLVGHIRSEQQTQDKDVGEEVDLYLYRTASEETLIEDLGFSKDESGIYPTLEDAVFTCSEGAVNSISLGIYSNDTYSFCGVHIGDSLEEAEKNWIKLIRLLKQRTCHMYK